MKLYNARGSGNCYKVRLAASLLGAELELSDLDLAAGENRSPEFLALNPRGQIPTLVDGDRVIWDSQAILVYLARTHGDRGWLPEDTDGLVAVMQWLAVAENEVLYGLARARAVKLFGRPWDLAQSQALGRAGLEVMDARLERREWLAADQPTIADIACYPYVSLAEEGEVALAPYRAVQGWMKRIEALPGWVGL